MLCAVWGGLTMLCAVWGGWTMLCAVWGGWTMLGENEENHATAVAESVGQTRTRYLSDTA
jgi:hypothetical protein